MPLQMRNWSRRAWVAGLAVAVAVGVGAADFGLAGAAVTKAKLRSLLLQAEDLGAGWKKINLGSSSGSTPSCLATFNHIPKSGVRAAVQFVQAAGSPLLSEELQTGPGAGTRLVAAEVALHTCSTLSINENGQEINVVIQSAPSFPQIGDASSAFTGGVRVANATVGLDIVLFRAGPYVGEILFVTQGIPNQGQVAGYALDAVANLRAIPAAPPAG